MLAKLEHKTLQLKLQLIELGYELPPASVMHSNKLKQIDMDFKQMSNILRGTHSDTLFENATAVLFECTSYSYIIRTLNDLMEATSSASRYIESY